MGIRDITGKEFFSDRERFAELVNLHLYRGEQVLTDLFHMAGHEEGCLENTIQDYEFLLLEADFLRPEDYRTELKAFFQAMQCRQDKGRLKELLHSDDFRRLCPETELAIAAHLHIKRLVQKMKKGDMPMCKAFDDLMKEERRIGKREGVEKGMEQGIRKGKKEERRDIISRMRKEGMDEAQIIRLTRCTKKEYTAAVSGI